MFLDVGGVECRNEPKVAVLAQVKPSVTHAEYYDVDLTQLPNLPGTAEEVRAAADIIDTQDSKLLVSTRWHRKRISIGRA